MPPVPVKRRATVLFASLCLLAAFAGIASAQQAGVTIEGQVAAKPGAPAAARVMVEPYVGIGRGGVWSFVYGSDGYVSAVAGPYVDLVRTQSATLEIGGGLGLEHFRGAAEGHHLRSAAFVTLLASKGKAELYYERGEDGARWIQAEATVRIAGALDVGVFHQSDDGTGPRAIVSIPALPQLKLWAGPMFKHDVEERRVRTVWLAAVDVTFGK